MKKMIKGLCVLLSIAFILGCCGCAPEEEEVAVGDVNVGKMGPYETPITIETAVSYYITSQLVEGQTKDDNCWTQLYKDMGINVKYRFSTPNDQYDEKMNIAIATGNIPDIVTVNSNQLVKLIKADLLYSDLGPIFEKYATDKTKEVMGYTENDPLFQQVTVDGKLKALPYTDNKYDSADIMYIRKDWLKKVGMEAPKTIDEFERMLDAFVNQDPDGNGENDTEGLVGCKQMFGGAASVAGIFNAYGAYPHIWIEDKPGHITYGGLSQAMKAPLAKLAEWYKKGYINKDFAVKDMQKAGSLIMSSQAGVWFGNMTNPGWPLATTVANDFSLDWEVCPVPSATNEPAKGFIGSTMGKFHVVSKKCKNPEAVVLLMNAFTEKMWGDSLTPEEHDAYAQMSSFALCQAWPRTKNLDAYRNITAAVDSGDTSSLTAEERLYYNNVKAYIDRGYQITDTLQQMDWIRYKIFYKGGSQSVIDYYVTNNLYEEDRWNFLDTPTMLMKKRTMESSVKEMVIKIIMGQIPVSDFDKEVDKIMKAGASEMIKEANEIYAAQKSN